MRTLIPIVTAGILLVGTVSVYGADQAFSSDVVLSVDGQKSDVRTYASTVGQALAAAKIEVGEHDTVAPSASSKVVDGTQISVRYGRPVTVSIDGKATTIWTTATTVEEALGLFGVDQSALVSTSRSTTISREGLAFDVSSAHKVTVTADGSTSPVTASGTVAAAVGTKTATVTTPAATGNTCGVSWYASGSRTANGEAFNPDGITAAHKTLPFNTQVKVTNVANGQSIVVRINDRGPYIDGRCLDLARGAFSQIASLGSGTIIATWEIVG